jgi:hypothetical protein
MYPDFENNIIAAEIFSNTTAKLHYFIVLYIGRIFNKTPPLLLFSAPCLPLPIKLIKCHRSAIGLRPGLPSV